MHTGQQPGTSHNKGNTGHNGTRNAAAQWPPPVACPSHAKAKQQNGGKTNNTRHSTQPVAAAVATACCTLSRTCCESRRTKQKPAHNSTHPVTVAVATASRTLPWPWPKREADRRSKAKTSNIRYSMQSVTVTVATSYCRGYDAKTDKQPRATRDNIQLKKILCDGRFNDVQ